MNMRSKLQRSYLILNGMEFTRAEFILLVRTGASPSIDAERYWDEAIFDLLAKVGQPIYIYQELVQVINASLNGPEDWEKLRAARESAGRWNPYPSFAILQEKEGNDDAH